MARPPASPLTAGWRGALARLRSHLTARPDTEHEQAIVRLAVGTLIVLYLVPGAIAAQQPTMVVMLCYLAIAAGIFVHILAAPGESPTRRVLGTLADLATLTWVMAFLGERAAPLFLVYVWVTLANGFRFGQRYLLISLGVSVGGFLVVLWENAYWHQQSGLGYGLLIGFIVLSLYVRSLVTKLFDALARAEAANLAKRRFISVVSHEMRTPLNAIIGMADLMRDTALSREQADMLQTLRSSSRVMLGLVDDVLDFSKIEAGKLVLEKADFDLHALVNSTCRILTAQAAAKGLDFVVSIMPEVPPALRGDPHHLRQILINLAGNAVKFTERGSVTVHVSAQAETEISVRLKFSIRDTGIGIPAEAQAQIFESFTQADQSTTRRFGGTGLGTTIAKQLVTLMGGRIGLESSVGLGTTFWIELDLEKQPERASLGTGELADARVLLVGVPSAQREAFVQALGGWGAGAFAAANIEEAASRLTAEISRAKPYHSAILYSENGDLKAAERFRRAAPDPAPPAILAVPREAGVQRFVALSAGFAAVLELPFDKRFLFNVLHSVSAGDDLREGVVRLQDYARRGDGARRLRVLVADDNPTNREVAGKILERGGHTVTLVNDGEQALDALERERHDAVVLDRNMPGLGGVATLQAIRLMTGGLKRVPVVMLSADATPDAKREALEAGCDAFLSKPIEALRLLETIDSLTAREETRHAERPPILYSGAVRPQPPEVINRETLGHLEDLGASSGFVEKLLGVFVADNTALLARIEQAVAGRNYQEIRSLLHAMKGSSASMGTDRLTAVCGSFGGLSDAELRLQGPVLVRSLGEEFASARGELERYLRSRQQSAG
jgi:two-component system sensor histidine kinase RpfC